MSLINLESFIGWISRVAALLLTVDLQPNIIDIIGTFENAFFAQDSFSTKLTFIYIVCLTWSEPSSSSEARIQPTQMQDRFLHISRELHLTYLVSRACLYKVDQYRIFQ